MFEKDPTKINAVLDMSATKTEINKFIKEVAPQLQEMFSKKNINVDLKDIETSMVNVFKESEKAAKDLANAKQEAYEMNKTFDKQKLAEKQKIHQAEIQAYKENEAFDKKQYLDREQAYKTEDTLRQKSINDEKNLYLAKQEAYEMNKTFEIGRAHV